MRLSLGVLDIVYADPEDEEEVTTFEVAKKLEVRYQVMGVFVDDKMEAIKQIVIDSVLGEIESMKMGKPKPTLAGRTMGRVEELFRDYLDADEWQRITGKTIMSARLGLSRRKEPTGEPRPAFIDTGLYQSTFRAWLNVDSK